MSTKKATTTRVAAEDLAALAAATEDLLDVMSDLREAEERAVFVDNLDHRARLDRDARDALAAVLDRIATVVDIDADLLAEVIAP